MTAAWTSVELVLTVIGVILVVLGALIAANWEEQIDLGFQQEMVLSGSSQSGKNWASPSVEIISHLYFWNWTNAADIGQPDYKPVLREVGPYTFSEKRNKVNLTWNDNGTVSYHEQNFFYFRPELSAGNLTDNITSVNVIAATLSEMSKGWSKWAQMSLSMALVSQQQKITWTRTVDELTYEGFKNPIQSMGSIFSSEAKDKFGFFYGMNGTISPNKMTISTGAKDIYTLGEIESVNGKNTTSAHTAGSCSVLHGSLGDFWSPHLTPQSVLNLFTPDMCRTNRYYFERESDYNGIPSYIYSSSDMTVDNGTLSKENQCYCDPSGCMPSGLYDLRTCQMGAPVFMSHPHLYLADPTYRDAIVGMNPQADKHKFFFEVEPRTAIPLKVAARVQLNVMITQNKGLSTFRNVETVLLPVWWMETLMGLPAEHSSNVKFLITLIFFGPYISGVIIFLGSVLLISLICRRYNAFRSVRQNKIVKVVGERESMGIIGRSIVSDSSDYPTQSTKFGYLPSESSGKIKEIVPLMVTPKSIADEAPEKMISSEGADLSSYENLDVRL